MALIEGTNMGFCAIAPTLDPAGANLSSVQDKASFSRFSSPLTAVHISEIGWWCDNNTTEANFEVGIYDHDMVLGKPGNLLASSRINAKGVNAGWKKSVMDFAVTGGTVYWLAFQLDHTLTLTATNYRIVAGKARGVVAALTLPASGGAAVITADQALAIYCVWQPASTTNPKYKSGGVFATKPCSYKTGGDFVTKQMKVKVAGVFQ